MNRPDENGWRLHLVSDSTGNLAGHMVEAALTQFPALHASRIYHVFQQSAEQFDRLTEGLRRNRDIVLYAVVSSDLKRHIRAECRRLGIRALDLTGALVNFLARSVGQKPAESLDRVHDADENYFRRIAAMEFTAQHDDGRRIESIGEADIILVGLSRVSKSPTATWLGSLGYRVANVSVAPETGIPKEIDRNAARAIGFTIQPARLTEIRARRFEKFNRELRRHGLPTPYSDPEKIEKEIRWAEEEFARRGIPMLDITDLTVEETGTLALTKSAARRADHVYA